MIGLVSDTHGLLRPEVAREFRGVERILHMGDVGDAGVLEGLSRIAPVTAVRGNVDLLDLPEEVTVEYGGAKLHLIHDVEALRFDPASRGIRIVLSGHTHLPAEREAGGVRYVNPGAAGPRRFSRPVSIALLGPDLRIRFLAISCP